MIKILIIILTFWINMNLSATNLDNLKFGPVPFSPFSDTKSIDDKFVVYGQVEDNAVVEYFIYTLIGDLVDQGKSTKTGGEGNQVIVEWDGRNKDGRYVADGGYIMQIKSVSSAGSVIKFVKLLVIKDRS